MERRQSFLDRVDGLIVIILLLLLTVAVGGAVIALVGAVFGLSSVTSIGASIAGLGAIGFFGWMFVTGHLAGALLGRSHQRSTIESGKNAKVENEV
ncbi:hypothetical protein [Mesorhizobium loti]|uniref:Uncharacterized protein n=1 Tax=Mesorhizobium loti R88b TaxID=935548 RepID=A0A6M7WRI4_RHILI|nr:hypothetical protein [Mesorhizobium loti]QKD04176.1 hypothetical protein EB235_24075 [Mesorhizobium loti R88b]